MSLDFNTLEPQKQNSITAGIAPSNHHFSSESSSPISSSVSRTQTFLLISAFLFSVLAMAGMLYTLSHMPKPELVSIQCSPDLLKKIENQAEILEEIAKKAKSKK